MSTAHPDRRFVEADSWTASGSKEEMLDMFHDFCPRYVYVSDRSFSRLANTPRESKSCFVQFPKNLF